VSFQPKQRTGQGQAFTYKSRIELDTFTRFSPAVPIGRGCLSSSGREQGWADKDAYEVFQLFNICITGSQANGRFDWKIAKDLGPLVGVNITGLM